MTNEEIKSLKEELKSEIRDEIINELSSRLSIGIEKESEGDDYMSIDVILYLDREKISSDSILIKS